MIVAVLGLLSPNAIAQSQKPSPTPETREQKGEASDEDRVYSSKEVDKRAVITNRKELEPGRTDDCPSGAKVVVAAILRKSGEVTDIKVTKTASCSLDKKAATIIGYAKFTPAMKDGVAVSQHIKIIYEFRRL